MDQWAPILKFCDFHFSTISLLVFALGGAENLAYVNQTLNPA